MNGQQSQLDKLTKTIKKQRIVVSSLVLLLIILLAGNVYQYFVFSREHLSDININKYPLIDPAREFIAQEDAVTNLQPLRDYLNSLVETETNFDISIYYEFLNTGSNISINQDTRFYPASLVKLPGAMVAMKKIENGEWQLDSELVLMQQDLDTNSGRLFETSAVGTHFTIEEVVKISLTKSDNTAHNMLMRNIELEKFKTLVGAVGLYDLFNEDAEVSSKEYSRLLRSLYTASYLRRENSEKILEWLGQADFHDFLSQGVPAGTMFAHKYGEQAVDLIFMDAGIVYAARRPYILTVLLKGKQGNYAENSSEAQRIMKLISTEAYKYVENL